MAPVAMVRASALVAACLGLPLLSGCLTDREWEYWDWDVKTTSTVAFLTWDDGQGGIAWDDPEAKSDDPGGSTANEGAQVYAAWTRYTNTGEGWADIPRTRFTSAPFPETLYLNVTRPIQAELFLIGSQCPDLNSLRADVELRLDDGTFVGGGIHGTSHLHRDGPNSAQGNPETREGHCYEDIRIHPETDRLSAGRKLFVDVLHVSQLTEFRFGLAGKHHSNITFPIYSPDDASRRIPELADETVAAGPSGATLLPFAGILGAPWMARVRARRSMCAALLATLAVAGCLASGGEKGNEKTGNIRATVEGLPEGFDPDGTTKGNGTLVGKVHDELGNELTSVHVSVTNTKLFTESDARGRFAINDVPAGRRLIRLDLAEYFTVEEEVVIVADKLTRADVAMYPVVDKGPGFRRHSHDQWGGKESKPLWSGDVAFNQEFNELTSTSSLVGSCLSVGPGPFPYASVNNANYVCFVPFFVADDALVIPGTYDVEAKISWDAEANKVPRVGIAIQDNNMDVNEQRLIYPKENGETTHFRAGWGMTDTGHQRFTTWNFGLYIPTNSYHGPTPGSSDIGVGPGASLLQTVTKAFHVDLTIHKGILPLERPHKDYWGGRLTTEVLRDVIVTPDPTLAAYPEESPTLVPSEVVPPETTWLEVKATRDGTDARDWTFVYKPANLPAAAPTSSYKAFPDAAKTAGAETTWNVVLADEEPDVFYQTRSNWLFALDDQADGATFSVSPVSWELLVIAHRDPAPR